MVMSTGTSYESEHLAFVTSENGTTVGEILRVLLSASLTPLLSTLIIPWIVPPKFIRHATDDFSFYAMVRAVVEYPVVVVLPLWIVTAFVSGDGQDADEWSKFILIVLICCCLGIMVVNSSVTEPRWEGIVPFWNQVKDEPLTSGKFFSFSTSRKSRIEEIDRKQGDVGDKLKYPFITNYRAVVIYITIIAILAVDFPIFPRRFAKTKTYGYSLMDIGTGSFIFCNGIIAPEAKGRKSNLLKSLVSCIPLFCLGCIRLVTVKGMEYHEVVEEYGVHWNFFFTLMAVKLLSALLFSVMDPSFSLKLSFIVGCIYEYFLVRNDLIEKYLLNPYGSRDTLLDANREGLLSVWGYLTIYFASVYIGKVISAVPNNKIKDWSLYFCRSGTHVLLLWTLFLANVSYGYPCCRRAANLSYVLWILAMNSTILWAFVGTSLLQSFAQTLGLLHGPLIAFELQSMMDQEEEKIKKLNQQFKKKRAGKSAKEVEVEKGLLILEDKLKEFQKADASKKASILQEVSAILQTVEEDMTVVEADANREDSDSDDVSKKLGLGESNSIPMPDLTKSPVTLEAICYNGLLVFLVGNVFTGLVNCLVQALYVPDYLALIYLWLYATAVTIISSVLYIYQIQVKFW